MNATMITSDSTDTMITSGSTDTGNWDYSQAVKYYYSRNSITGSIASTTTVIPLSLNYYSYLSTATATATSIHRDFYTSYDYDWNYCCNTKSPLEALRENMRQIIAERMAPVMRVRRHIIPTSDVREQRARETLRRVIGPEKFRQFLKNGFVSVRAASGKIYQIYPGSQQTVVYEHGQPTEKLCVVMRDNFPPTDELIVRYLVLLNNEELFRQTANRFGYCRPSVVRKDGRSLPQIMADLRVA